MFAKQNDTTSTKSIKTRLVGQFILIILISVIGFEALLIYFTKYYFYSNTETVLTNQIKMASDFYSRYFSNVSLEENVMDNVDVFWKQTEAQVQIIDLNGVIMLDSGGQQHKNALSTADFREALKGEKGVWVGNVESHEKVMAVSYPLKSGQKIVGVLRYMTTLNEVDHVLRNVVFIFISIGVIVIVMAGAISLLLARSIVSPLKEVTGAAELMADGNLTIKIKKERDDELGRLADTLNYMAEEIQKREKVKDEFISLVSHELRTPLTAVKGWAITLRSVEMNDQKLLHDGLAIIEQETDRLSDMVEELLDFSSFVSGKVSLKKEKTDLSLILDYIEKSMSQRAKREGIHFEVTYQQLPLLDLDQDRMKQVLINLLGNAFQFTPSGGKVMLQAYQDSHSVILSIRDTGCGISEAELPRVKDKFYKGKNSKSQTGLGLAICDEIIKMHNGEMLIKSKVNEGTEVLVSLPLEIRDTGDQYDKTKD